MNIDYTLFSNTQLYDAIDSLLNRVERDEAMRAELAAAREHLFGARWSKFSGPLRRDRGSGKRAHRAFRCHRVACRASRCAHGRIR